MIPSLLASTTSYLHSAEIGAKAGVVPDILAARDFSNISKPYRSREDYKVYASEY